MSFRVQTIIVGDLVKYSFPAKRGDPRGCAGRKVGLVRYIKSEPPHHFYPKVKVLWQGEKAPTWEHLSDLERIYP